MEWLILITVDGDDLIIGAAKELPNEVPADAAAGRSVNTITWTSTVQDKHGNDVVLSCSEAHFVEVADGAYVPGAQVDTSLMWDGAAVVPNPNYVEQIEDEDPLNPYVGKMAISSSQAIAIIGQVVSASKYTAFKWHWAHDSLIAAIEVDPQDEDGRTLLDTGFAALVADTSWTQKDVDSVITALPNG